MWFKLCITNRLPVGARPWTVGAKAGWTLNLGVKGYRAPCPWRGSQFVQPQGLGGSGASLCTGSWGLGVWLLMWVTGGAVSSGGRWDREAPHPQRCGSQGPVDHSVQTWAHTRKRTISRCPVVGMRGSDAPSAGPDVGEGQGSPHRLLEKYCLRDQAQSPASTCSPEGPAANFPSA